MTRYYACDSGTVLDDIECPLSTTFLGYSFGAFSEDRSVVTAQFQLRVEHLNAAGVAQGGILAAMLDEVSGVLVVGKTEGRVRPVSLSMSLSFISSARNGTLQARAEFIKLGKSTAFVAAELRTPDGDLVVKAEQVLRLLDKR